ncbi:MAG: hypothetical protein AAF628_37745 [Planctomycetota bacterium]
MRNVLGSAALLLAAAPLSAQADHFTTSPEDYDFVEGNSFSDDLLGSVPQLRYQQIDATNSRQLLATNRIAFRRDGRALASSAAGPRNVELEVVCAESDIDSISTNFASNYLANESVVVSRITVSFDDWVLPQGLAATATNTVWFDQLWDYTGTTMSGHDLLWELRVYNNDSAGQPYPFDFEYAVRGASFGTPVPMPSVNTTLSTGCTVGSFTNAHSLRPVILNDGSTFRLQADSMFGPTGAPTFMFIDAIDRGLPVPGLCDTLHATLALIPMGTSDPVFGVTQTSLDLPYQSSAIGAPIYAQAVAPDASQSGIQVSVSSAVQMDIPQDPPKPLLGRVWALDPMATDATAGPLPGGIIIWTNHP